MSNKLDFVYNDSWEEAKRLVSNLGFPQDVNIFKQDSSITGHAGSHKHRAMYYKAVLPPVKGFPLEASYLVCNECTEKVKSQKFYLFNNSRNLVYIRELLRGY